MLPREFRLLSLDFRRLKRKGQVLSSRLLVVSYSVQPGSGSGPTFGFVVSKALSKKATQRNLIKRRLSQAVWDFLKGKARATPPWRICLIARKPILASDYATVAAEVDQLLSKIFEL